MSRLREAMDAVRSNPKNAGAWVILGELLGADGQTEKATQSFQRALQLDPTNITAQRGLAQILLADKGGNAGAGGLGTGRLTPPPTNPSTPRATAQSMPALPPHSAPSHDASPPRAPRPTREAPVTPSRPPISREEAAPRRTAPRPNAGAAVEMRTPPAQAIKPSQGRMMLGIGFLIAIPLLCLCALVFALAQLI
jgi:hypothetical protein